MRWINSLTAQEITMVLSTSTYVIAVVDKNTQQSNCSDSNKWDQNNTCVRNSSVLCLNKTHNTRFNCSDTTYRSAKAPRKFASEVTRNRSHNTEHNNAQQNTEQNSRARTANSQRQFRTVDSCKISCYVTILAHAHILYENGVPPYEARVVEWVATSVLWDFKVAKKR